jgi:diguanylate cyclase (GGDEF)-like protein/PAS domain S-box-containing protein
MSTSRNIKQQRGSAQPNDRDSLLAEIEMLKTRVAELQQVETRCLRAEACIEALEARNRLLGDSAPMGIFTVDAHGKLTGTNRKMREMLPPALAEEAIGTPFLDILPHLGSDITDDFKRCLEQAETVIAEASGVDWSGKQVHLRFCLSPLLGVEGTMSGALAFVEDITQQKQAEADVKESEKRYRLLFQSAPIALIERDASRLKAYAAELCAAGVADFKAYLRLHPEQVGRCMGLIRLADYNDAFVELLETERRPDLLATLAMANSAEFHNIAEDIVLTVLDASIPKEREVTFVTLKGNKRSVVGKAIILPGHEETLSRIVIALLDVTSRKQAEEALRASEQQFRHQAIRDDLTGLYNQRYLYQSLAELLETSRFKKARLSLLFMDLDDFKSVVDAHGHLNGSRAIRQVAATIQSVLQEPAYAVAYAGDEFVVVLPGFDGEMAAGKAAEIRTRMKKTLYLRDQGLRVRLRASFGIATFPDHASEVNSLLAAADKALFAVKRNGKDAAALSTDQSPGA